MYNVRKPKAKDMMKAMELVEKEGLPERQIPFRLLQMCMTKDDGSEVTLEEFEEMDLSDLTELMQEFNLGNED